MDLINKIIESFEKGNYSLAFIVVMILLVIKSKNIYSFYKEFKQQKIKTFKELYSEDNLDEHIKKMLNDYINNEVFYQLTGIYTEKFLRNKIIETYETAQGLITYRDLKIAHRFLTLKDGELVVKINLSDKIDKWFNIFLSTLLLIIASYIISLPSITDKPSLVQILISTSFGILTYLFAGFLIAQTFPIKKAKKIEGILQNLTKARNE